MSGSEIASPNPPNTNANLAWADHFVSELAACGLTAVCIAPGSRSTPLTLAFARHPAIKHYLHLDERSASFFALGLAMATDQPVALLCTSGTAAAEFYPAVIEAAQSQVPLIVLTSDRPHELRYSGANQTIDQVKLYGDHVRWAFDLALPEAQPPAVVQRSIATVAARAYAIANGLVKGPVHLNLPFRKPLEPAAPPLPAPTTKAKPAARIGRGTVTPTATQLDQLAALVNRYERGLIVCGPGASGGSVTGARGATETTFPAAVVALAAASGYPILADPLAGLRFGPAVESGLILGGYDAYLQGGDLLQTRLGGAPDVVIRFGAVPTSQRLNNYLEAEPPAHLIHIRENGIWADDLHIVTDFLQADPTAVCHGLVPALQRGQTDWTAAWITIEKETRHIVADYIGRNFFDGAVVATILETVPAGTRLMIGNSLPIRHVDQFGFPRPRLLTVYGNRGASGIDGVTSTALGIAAADAAPLVLITGDITFYHDMNGLLALRQHNLHNVTIVLLNNDGGSIFRRLPVAKFEPHFSELFLTPHGLDFSHAAALYGVAYQQSHDLAALRAQLVAAIMSKTATIIEVQTDGEDDLNHQRELVQQIVDTIT